MVLMDYLFTARERKFVQQDIKNVKRTSVRTRVYRKGAAIDLM